jgi:hypothetical protein
MNFLLQEQRDLCIKASEKVVTKVLHSQGDGIGKLWQWTSIQHVRELKKFFATRQTLHTPIEAMCFFIGTISP